MSLLSSIGLAPGQVGTALAAPPAAQPSTPQLPAKPAAPAPQPALGAPTSISVPKVNNPPPPKPITKNADSLRPIVQMPMSTSKPVNMPSLQPSWMRTVANAAPKPQSQPAPRIAATFNSPAMGGLNNPIVAARDNVQQMSQPKAANHQQLSAMVHLLKRIAVKHPGKK